MEMEAPSDGLLKSVSDHIEVWDGNSRLLLSINRIPPDHLMIINKWAIKCVMYAFINRELSYESTTGTAATTP